MADSVTPTGDAPAGRAVRADVAWASPHPVDVESMATLFKALGDPVRLRLATLIADRDEVCVCDLAPGFTVSGPTLSHHLKVLRQAGIVESQRRGTWVYYRIRPAALAAMSRVLTELRECCSATVQPG